MHTWEVKCSVCLMSDGDIRGRELGSTLNIRDNRSSVFCDEQPGIYGDIRGGGPIGSTLRDDRSSVFCDERPGY